MKKNDFIVASINNPDFTVADFKDISEMNLGNTLMLSEDEYLKSKFIKENPLFLDSNGNFVKQKFTDFYKLKLKEFGEFSTESSLDNYQYGLFDTFRKAKDNIRPFGVSFERVANSERKSTGIVGPNLGGERLLSDRELAQREKVFDYKTGQFRDYSPNDLAFTHNPFAWIGSLFDDPLVLATYDENGTHFDPILGREVEHYKGQKKLNDRGVPYYETLAGRSAANKDILSITDNLTVDGSWLNKYDFFDSDGMDKSVAGTVMKNVAVLAPMFIPGAGQYYAGALVAREMSKALPMLYGMAGLFDNDIPESSLVNTVAGIGTKFTGNTSDYSKEKMFSFENFGSLISDVALQWGQQQWVINNISKIQKANKATEQAAKAKALGEYTKQANALMSQGERGEVAMSRVTQLTGAKDRAALNELTKGDQWMATVYGGAAWQKHVTPAMEQIAKRTKIAQDLSLAYMAIISNGDVYQDALSHGTSKREAAMLALGSTVGMWSVDKYLGLGEIFYDPALRAERATFRSAILGETKKITEQLSHLTPEVTVKAGKAAVTDERKGLGKYFLKGILAGKKAVQDYRGAIKEGTLGFFGKALGEGLEEVSEELVTDIVKQLGEIAGEYGLSEVRDLGAWANAKDRYLMSFLGGAIGGGIFSLKDGNFKARQAQGELLTLLRQGKGQEIRDELARLHKDGDLGSTELSYKTEETTDEKGNVQSVFLTADENNLSQNDYAYNTLTLAIEQIETILQKNHLTKTEDELFEQLVLLDENYTALKDYLQDASYITGYQRRYQQLTKNIVNQELHIEELKRAAGDGKGSVELDRAKADLDKMLLERDKFFNGDYSLEYMLKMLFAINPQLVGAFMPLTKKQYARQLFNTDYDFLDGGMKEFVDKLYEQAVKDPSKIEEELDKSFDKFKQLQPLMEPILSRHMGGSEQWERIRKMLDEEGILKNEDMYDYNSLLPGEDEESESYVNRNTQLEGESPLDFTKRRKKRLSTVAEINARNKIQKLQRLLDEAKTWGTTDPTTGMVRPGTFIDPSTKRYLMSYLGETLQQIKNRLIAHTVGTGINKELLDNAENYPELVNKVRESLKVRYGKLIADQFIERFGTADYGGLTYFFSQLSPNRKFTLKEVLHGVNREGWEGYSLAEQLREMLSDAAGDKDFDVILKVALYEDIYAQYMAEDDEEKQRELKDLLDTLETEEFEAWDEETYNQMLDDMVNQEMERLKPQLQRLNELFKSDEDLKAAKDLEDRLSVEENPAVELVKELAPKIGSEAVEVEKALESILKLFRENEKAHDFILSGDQIKYLEEAKKLINIVTAMVAASSRPSNILDGMTYNKAVNKFYEAHKGKQGDSEFFLKFEPLFEMDEKIGGQLIMALNGYTREIDQWIQLSMQNQANSAASLLRAEEALSKSRLKFLSTSMASNEFLKDSIVDSKGPNALFHFEKQFHDNVLKAIAEGRDLKDIMQGLLAHINQDEQVISGVTSNVDEELEELTAYDKFMYLVSLIGIDPQKQLELERDFIKANPDIAPLATQQPAMQLGQALAADPKVINAALEALQELAERKGLKMPVMYNTTIVTGLGGAGKTSVEAKYLINEDEDTWVAGPTSKQVETLSALAPKAKAFGIDALLKLILPAELAKKVLDESADVKESKSKGGLDNLTTTILKGIKDSDYVVKDAPKHLVIDEATHIGNLALQALGNWARLTGTRITLLGDENQRGKGSEVGKAYNLARETLLAFRTPRLNFSLRNESIWKVSNQRQIVSLLDKMRGSTSETSSEIFAQVLEALHNKLGLSFFENDKQLEGDKVTSSISSEDLSKLSGSVAYIGNNKERINFIQSHLGSGVTSFEIFDKDSVQGREFDYVIVDSDWGGKLLKSGDKKAYETHISEAAELLRDLYTMISRSRRGSIVLDNGISEIINPVKEDYTTKYERLTPEVIQDFILNRLNYIEGLLAELKPEEVTVEEKKEEEKKEEEKKEAPLEDIPPVDVSEEKKDEVEKVEKLPSETPGVGYRAYGNVQFKGNITSDGKRRWIPKSGPVRDLGLFIPGSDGILAHNGSEKRALVRDLNFLKSLFLYDLNIDLYDIPVSLQRVVTKEQLKAAKFFLVSEDKSEVHDLIGLTTLDDEKQDFIPGKVISIQARIETAKGPAVITLGAVADPSTWIEGIEKNPELSREEKDAQIAQARHYETLLKNLVESESLEIQINKPKFSGRTELIKLKKKDIKALRDAPDADERRKIRLESLWDGTSEWDARTGNSVVSPIHVLTDEIPGIDPSLVGHAVIFVSNNNTLSPERLGDLYLEQLRLRAAGTPSKAQVRMIVLDNAGVSFHSIYRNGFKDIYTTNRKESDFTFPFDLGPMGIRMLASLWNFRADLNKFINALNDFKGDNGITQEQLILMAKEDAELYHQLQEIKKKEYEESTGETLEKLPTPSNAEYKRWLETNSELDRDKVKRVQALIAFNEGLDIPRFRVGWSDRTGSVIRKIVGLKEDNPYYKDKFAKGTYTPDSINGIFINPDLAYQYSEMIEELFTNVIDRIFETTGLNKNERINYKEAENWVNNSKEKKLVIDHEGNTIPIPDQVRVKAVPLILAKIAQNLHYKMHFGSESFFERFSKEKSPSFHIYMDMNDKEHTDLDYSRLDEHLVTTIGGKEVRGLVQESGTRLDIIGQNDFTYEDSGDTVYQDCRMDNFFNLIFHGVAFEKNYNEFEDGQQVATDALFKYGFFIDPILIKAGGTASDMIAPCATNRCLFKTDVVPGNPILQFTFDKVGEGVAVEEKKEETVEYPILKELTRFGIDTSSWNFDGYEEHEVLGYILGWINGLNYRAFSKGEVNPDNIIVEVTLDGVKTLRDLLNEHKFGDVVQTVPDGKGTAVEYTDAAGKIIEVRFDGENITLNDKTAPGKRDDGEETNVPAVYKGSEINSKIREIMKAHSQYEESDSLEAWMEEKDGTEYSKDNLVALKKDLRATLDEEGVLDEDDIKLLENVIDEFINQTNETDCNK